jgi:hypothetical protein
MIFKKDLFFYKFYFYFSFLQFIIMTAYSEEKKGILTNFYFYFYSYLLHLFLGTRIKIAVAWASTRTLLALAIDNSVIVGEMLFFLIDLFVNHHLIVDCFTDQNIRDVRAACCAPRQMLSLFSALLPVLVCQKYVPQRQYNTVPFTDSWFKC